MSGVTEDNAQRLEKVNRYLMVGIALLVIAVILILIEDFA